MNTLKKLISKYATSGPRYTSYPTALYFSENASIAQLTSLAKNDLPASLYIHIPFCKSLCYFCGCSSSVCSDLKKLDDYITLLQAELELWRDSGMPKRTLKQIHFGGGTPNLMTAEQTLRVGEIIKKYFDVAPNAEISCEFDPRTLTEQKVDAFLQIGLNRASIGVQDTNVDVQKAINRIQPQEMNLRFVQYFREKGIESINTDLIYGLPLQTPQTFENTLENLMQLSPDRIALFGYAHVPWVKPSQKILEKNALPTSDEKVELFVKAMHFFEDNGYEYIGLDHFAKPQDSLIKARENGSLHRNFQGYSTLAGLDTFAIGLTSISDTKTSYRQNFKDMQKYAESVKAGKLPIERGLILNSDDIVRRGIIMDIMCSLKVVYKNYGVDFKNVFADSIARLAEFEKDGLVELSEDSFCVSKRGRLFLRNIAMLFDNRLTNTQQYSKTL